MESVTNPLNIELGKRIRQERERLSLNQDAFAEIANVTARTVIEWEKGKTFPNLLQLFNLKESGLNVSVLLDEVFKDKIVDHLTFNDLDFDDSNSRQVLMAINTINALFTKNPTWQLVNIETRYGEDGKEVGLRYYYKRPCPVMFDESQSFRDLYMADLIEDAHKSRSSYIHK